MATALKHPLEAQKNSENLTPAVQQSLGISHDSIYSVARDLVKSYSVASGHLLDFGAGRGDFLKSLASYKLPFMYHGVDLMYSSVAGVNWYVQDLNSKLQFKDQQFEVITCLEVIEHLENPRQIIRDLYRTLKPGGKLILSTPNNESWRSIISYIFRGHFVSFTETSYPAHITALNREDLYRIMQECQFKNIATYYSNDGMVPKLSGWSWQKISFGLLKGLRFSDNIIVTATK